ncbi:hypothetical protein [Streptomyces sp. NPDC002402]
MTDPAAGLRAMVLRETLRLAVPLHIEELRHLDGRQLADIAHACGAVVAYKGDDIQFGGVACREAFNALARGLAATALIAWGGVTFDGMHWCTTPGCPAVDDDHAQPYPWSPPPKAEPQSIDDVHLPEPEQAA